MALGEGFYTDVTAAEYHADPCEIPSLSSSIAKVIAFETPRHAWLAHPRLNPDFEHEDTTKFDLGSVAHEIVLGKGAELAVIEANDWRTKAAQEARAAAIALGKQPILEKDHIRASVMADAVNDALADMGVDLSGNNNECVLVWREGDVVCRAMLDSLERADTSAIIWDLKTSAAGLSDAAVQRTVVNLGYDLSANFYLRGLVKLFPELAGRVKFRWIFVETTPPHEVRVFEASGLTMDLGEQKANFAITRWHQCLSADNWPGYERKITTLFAPPWAETQWLTREESNQ